MGNVNYAVVTTLDDVGDLEVAHGTDADGIRWVAARIGEVVVAAASNDDFGPRSVERLALEVARFLSEHVLGAVAWLSAEHVYEGVPTLGYVFGAIVAATRLAPPSSGWPRVTRKIVV